MTRQLLIYDDPVPLSAERHHDLFVETEHYPPQTQALNAVPIVVSEFPKAASCHVLAFTRVSQIVPVVLLGLQNGQNLFMSSDGKWKTDYVPAFLRQYPFVLAGRHDKRNLTMCIDEAAPGLNREGRGQRLFDISGERTDYLDQVVEFAEAYQRDYARTIRLSERLSELDLIEDMSVKIDKGGQQSRLTGFGVVSRERLNALSDNDIAELQRSGALELVYHHLASLENFSKLIEL